MKQFSLLCAAILLACFTSIAQTSSLQAFVEKYKAEPGFTHALVSKDLLEMASELKIEEKDWKKLQNVVRNIGSLSILVADSIAEAPAVFKEALDVVPTDNLDELLTVRDGDDKVHIWVRDEGQTLTDLVLLVGTASDFVLIHFSGELELGNIAELAGLLNAEETQNLAKTAQAFSFDFSVSPNPSTGRLTLTHHAEASEFPVQATLTDANGRTVATLDLSPEKSQTLNFGNLPGGQYWVRVKTASGKIGVQQVQILRP